MENTAIRQLDKNNNEYSVTLARGGRGRRNASGEGGLNKETSLKSPSSVLRTSSPSGGEETHGFTLIELLVVVLIIGILAAVALPQYQKAVWKSRTAEISSVLSSMAKAQEAYFLENGSYATNWNDLALDLPLETTTDSPCWVGTVATRRKKGNTYFSIGGGKAANRYAAVSGVFGSEGEYNCSGLVYILFDNLTGNNLKPGLYCWVYGPKGKFCQQILNATQNEGTLGGWTIYKL